MQRTLSTLNAVHETLEKVVDRLSTFEAEIGDRRGGDPGETLARAGARLRAAAQQQPAAPPPPPFAEPRGSSGGQESPFSARKIS